MTTKEEKARLKSIAGILRELSEELLVIADNTLESAAEELNRRAVEMVRKEGENSESKN